MISSGILIVIRIIFDKEYNTNSSISTLSTKKFSYSTN